VLDERLNEIVRRVVGTSGCAFIALRKAELDGVAVVDEDRIVFEQAFVHGTELLHVEGSVNADCIWRILASCRIAAA